MKREEYIKLRHQFYKETKTRSVADKDAYIDWLEDKVVKNNAVLPVVSNCKNYTREDVIEILCKALKATGNEIKATMKDIRTRPHIVFEAKDLDRWIEDNV